MSSASDGAIGKCRPKIQITPPPNHKPPLLGISQLNTDDQAAQAGAVLALQRPQGHYELSEHRRFNLQNTVHRTLEQCLYTKANDNPDQQ